MRRGIIALGELGIRIAFLVLERMPGFRGPGIDRR